MESITYSCRSFYGTSYYESSEFESQSQALISEAMKRYRYLLMSDE